jgi:hypothetical protein
MNQVQYVAPNFINQVWDSVEPFISAALKYSSGEYTAEQLKVYLVQGQQSLYIAINEQGKIFGAAVVEFANYPNDRIAFITAIGGNMIMNKELWDQFVNGLVQNGSTKIRGAVRDSMARLLRKAFNFEHRYTIVEKAL